MSRLAQSITSDRWGVAGGLLVALVFFMGTGLWFVLGLHLQIGLGFTPFQAAIAVLPGAAGIMIGSGLSRSFVARLGRKTVLIGALIMAVGAVGMVLAVRSTEPLNVWRLLPWVIATGIGMSSVPTSLVAVVLAKVPESDSGAASGLINTMLQLGSAAGIALISAVFFGLIAEGGSYARATERSLSVETGIFLASAALSFLLPPGRLRSQNVGSQA